MFLDLVSPRTANLGVAFLFLITVLWLRYAAQRDRFAVLGKRDDAKGAPSTFPYVFPLLGSLPLAYLWDPRAFVLNPNNFFQSAHPVRVKILTQEFYAICGPENVKAFFRGSHACTSIPFVKFALGYAFGLHSKALRLYDKDDSGGSHVPHSDSTIEAHNRIDYRTYQSLIRFLEGKGLLPFWNRFADNITQQLHGFHDRIGSEWEYRDDIIEVVRDEATVPLLNALCGPYLLSLNPHFLQDYWEFDRNLQTYLQGMPWFLAPRAYAVRKRALNAVKIWQQHARDHFDDSVVDSDGDDQFWGSSFFRERQEMFLEMDGFDHDAVASQDFGAIWAVRNSIVTASWAIFEIFRDPELLASVRAEIDAIALTSADGHIQFHIDQLLRLPVLQAVYAETLRLRMDFYIIRMPDKVDMNIQDWIIPRRKVMVAPTTVAHMDSKAWSTGLNNEHPVDLFWIGRFLKYPTRSMHSVDTQSQDPASPTFSTKEFEGSWIPYGGGPRQCPGRHFAKRQILLTIALMVSLFDCEISEVGKHVQGDSTLKGFGSGVSLPDGKVPAKIRRRDRGNM
ncbi:cytochrome P450 [Annulohypoxylon maeteangense]|uniref:cytochrome P450 n=1 Tax=Annulohypoxylon maeteangense TaxID=1927788 RepID=UPI002007E9DB|nr:cytochrome P450 [Annulohypoxylon maeteangense]KAI0882867.1 cytochrome P450 [Annulohypoxylon maeteangense]